MTLTVVERIVKKIILHLGTCCSIFNDHQKLCVSPLLQMLLHGLAQRAACAGRSARACCALPGTSAGLDRMEIEMLVGDFISCFC